MEDRNKLRRLRVLQALNRVKPDPVGQLYLLAQAQADPELNPTLPLLKQSLFYLQSIRFVNVISVDYSDWIAASITDIGIDFLANKDSYNVGVCHPDERPIADNTIRGRVSTVKQLPVAVRSWLDQELIRLDFTSYKQLAEALKNKGFTVSRSAVHRYGKKFKDQQKNLRESIQQAKMLAEEVGGDGAAMNQALTALAQDKLMRIMHNGEYDTDIKLPDLVRATAQLNRADINTRKFQIEQKAKEQAAKNAEKSMIKQGINQDTIDTIKNNILGIG